MQANSYLFPSNNINGKIFSKYKGSEFMFRLKMSEQNVLIQ